MTAHRPQKPTGKRPDRHRNVRKNVRVATIRAAREKSTQGLLHSLLVVLGLMLAGAAGWGAFQGYEIMLARGIFAVHRIEIVGNVRIPEDRILARLDLPKQANLPDLNLTAISQSVLSHPWIERATVRRIFPDALTIRVWERTPVALLTESVSRGDLPRQLMVDRSGMILGRPNTNAADLPRLTGFSLNGLTAGDRVSARRVQTGLMVAIAYPDPSALVDVADLDDPLLLVGGMRIRLGSRGGYGWRLKRLQQLGRELEQLAGKHGAEVDLRYPDRVVARPL